MKTKVIKLRNHKGEIENGHSCNHRFSGELFTHKESFKEECFIVRIHVIDEETNTTLRVKKSFDNKENAINFLKGFVAKRPISEAVIFKKVKEEIAHYV